MARIENSIYFVSDVHLRPYAPDGKEVEKRFLSFLEERVSTDGAALFLLGDIFDFWYEYKYVIPRGYTRVLGTLARLSDSGVKIYFAKGNHDIWLYDYFQSEIGAKVIESTCTLTLFDKKFIVGHGDGLGKTDASFRFLRWLFRNPVLQTLFGTIHPRWAMWAGFRWSAHSRSMKAGQYEAPEIASLPIASYLMKDESAKDADYAVFGHYHIPGSVMLGQRLKLFILGDWSAGCEYLCYTNDSQGPQLLKWQ